MLPITDCLVDCSHHSLFCRRPWRCRRPTLNSKCGRLGLCRGGSRGAGISGAARRPAPLCQALPRTLKRVTATLSLITVGTSGPGPHPHTAHNVPLQTFFHSRNNSLQLHDSKYAGELHSGSFLGFGPIPNTTQGEVRSPRRKLKKNGLYQEHF